MKTIGLVGGTGWASSVEYYRLINEDVNNRLGGLNYAHCILYSMNYADIDSLNSKNDLEGLYALIVDVTHKLIASGAQGIALCANTLHLFADRLQQDISVPIIHIAEATARHDPAMARRGGHSRQPLKFFYATNELAIKMKEKGELSTDL